jgi:hypothetical protein
MLTLSTIKTAAFAIAGFIILGIGSGLISANVRRLATEFGWDTFFLWAWNAVPAGIRKMLSGWKPLRQLWWLWLSLGMSGGLGTALWLLSPEQMSISASAVDIARATDPIRANLDNAKQQIGSLQSQLDAKTKGLDTAQRKLQDAQNVPTLSPIDLSSGQQKILFISIIKVFNDLKDQQSELSSIADELAKAQVNQNALNPIFYYVPPCRIIVSSIKDNEGFAKLIETIAQSQGCKAEDAPPPPPPPRPTNADEPPPKPIIIPDPLPYIVVRYPKPEDVQNQPEPPYAIGAGRWRPIPSQEINEKTAKFRGQIADKLLAALQGCGLDARRSRKAEGNPGWPVDKWTIYIDLGNVQICH